MQGDRSLFLAITKQFENCVQDLAYFTLINVNFWIGANYLMHGSLKNALIYLKKALAIFDKSNQEIFDQVEQAYTLIILVYLEEGELSKLQKHMQKLNYYVSELPYCMISNKEGQQIKTHYCRYPHELIQRQIQRFAFYYKIKHPEFYVPLYKTIKSCVEQMPGQKIIDFDYLSWLETKLTDEPFHELVRERNKHKFN